MRWHTTTHGWGSERDITEWGGYPVSIMELQNIACPAQYQLTHIPWLPTVD